MLETAGRPILFTLLSLLVCTLALPDKRDFYVINDLLPGVSKIPLPLVPEMHAGQLALDVSDEENGRKLFFWRFSEAEGQHNNQLIIWLNGGPGCSSMDGALIEIGPFGVKSNGQLEANSGSWNQRGDLLFVDQPVGTGFSEVGSDGKYLQDLTEVTSDFLAFLENYYNVFPEDREKDLVLAGESYGGQYLPYIGDAIISRNKELEGEGKQPLKLKAVLIGNGWIAPNEQSLSYVPFAMQKGLLTSSMDGYQSLISVHERCQNRVNSGDGGFMYPECDEIVGQLLRVTSNMHGATDQQCINLYDYRLRSSYPACGANWPPGVGYIVKFFGRPGVLEALHLDKSHISQWQECNSDVNVAMTNPVAKPAVTLLPGILEAGVQLVLFNGDKDVICNNLGVETMISTLQWSGAKGFSESSKEYKWFHEGSQKSPIGQSGFVRSERNLTFVSVFNASHMVPMNVGGVSRGIVDIANHLFEITENAENGTQQLVTHDNYVKTSEEALQAIGGAPKGTSTSSLDREKIQRENNRFTFVVLCLTAFSAVWVVLYYSLREKCRVCMRGFLMDPNSRKPGRPKNLPMDQDLEFGDFDVENFDLGDTEVYTHGTNKHTKNARGGYIPIPT